MDYANPFANVSPVVLVILFIWSYIWKGLALWHAVSNKQRGWFIFMLILNTFGILEITYLFFFSKKKFNIESLKFWK